MVETALKSIFLANLYGISGAVDKHFCLWCLKTKDQMHLVSKEPVASRNLDQMKQNNTEFMTKGGGDKKKASQHNNVVRAPLVDIPISDVVPPILHILLGVVKKHHTILEEKCDDIDKDLVDRAIETNGQFEAISPRLKKYIKALKS